MLVAVCLHVLVRHSVSVEKCPQVLFTGFVGMLVLGACPPALSVLCACRVRRLKLSVSEVPTLKDTRDRRN